MMAYLPNIYFLFLQNWDRGCIKYARNATVSGALDNLNGPCQQVSTMLYTIELQTIAVALARKNYQVQTFMCYLWLQFLLLFEEQLQ